MTNGTPGGDVMDMDTRQTPTHAAALRKVATDLDSGWNTAKSALTSAAAFGGDPVSAAAAQVYQPQRDVMVVAADKVPPLYQGAADVLAAAIEVYRTAQEKALQVVAGCER
jgi:hypothetical protein